MKITAIDVYPVGPFVYIKISTDNDLYGIPAPPTTTARRAAALAPRRRLG